MTADEFADIGLKPVIFIVGVIAAVMMVAVFMVVGIVSIAWIVVAEGGWRVFQAGRAMMPLSPGGKLSAAIAALLLVMLIVAGQTEIGRKIIVLLLHA